MAEVRPRSQQQPPSNETRDAYLISGIAALIAVNAAPKPTATKIATLIGVQVAAVMPVVALALSRPWTYEVTTVGGPVSPTATGEAAEAEGLYRAAYILAASRRWQQGLANGTPPAELNHQEARWFTQHIAAQENRRAAALKVDAAQRRWGNELGWYATIDAKTTPECRAANGRNFNPAVRPAIGYPGSVHPNCRCKAGRPHRTSQTVYDIKPDRRAS